MYFTILTDLLETSYFQGLKVKQIQNENKNLRFSYEYIKCYVFFLFRKDYILENLLLTLVDVRLFSRIGHILVARQDDISHWSAGHWTLISSPKGR